MLVRKYVVPVLAVAGVVFAIYTVKSQGQAPAPAAPVSEPARSPFDAFVAGAGLIEASTENIEVGAVVAGVVTTVHVKVGDRVNAGDPLFTVDERAARAEILVREAAVRQAEADLARLRAQPRSEEVPPAEARVVAAEAAFADARTQLEMASSVADRRAVSAEEVSRRRFALAAAEARLAEARADVALLKAGAWAPEIAVSEARLAAARAELESAKTELDRLTVRAPVTGTVLQRNIRAGEFAQAGATATPLLLLGDVQTLHVRVDVDENDAWRVREGAPAEGSLRGNSAIRTGLTFVRVEPYVVPKRSLTGESTERVDTRVLQLIYSFPAGALPAYAGQQVDVFIKAEPRSSAGGVAPGAPAAPVGSGQKGRAQ